MSQETIEPTNKADFKNTDLGNDGKKDQIIIDSPCILSTDNILHLHQSYLLFDYPKQGNVVLTPVILEEIYESSWNVRAALRNILTEEIMFRMFIKNMGDERFNWLLAEIAYLQSNLERLEVLKYCKNDQ